MGIQTIERNLRKSSSVDHTLLSPMQRKKHEVNMEALADTRSAFDSALAILNDLLNFDKLESGTFQIEPVDVVALRYLDRDVKHQLALLQSREMTASLRFDVREADGGHEEDGLEFLDAGDVLLIDKHKVHPHRSSSYHSSLPLIVVFSPHHVCC